MKTLVFSLSMFIIFGLSPNLFINGNNDAPTDEFKFPKYSSEMAPPFCTCAVRCFFGPECCQPCNDGGTCTCYCIGWFGGCSCTSCKKDSDPEQLKQPSRKAIVYSLSKEGHSHLKEFCYFLVSLENQNTIRIAKKIAESVKDLEEHDYNSYEACTSDYARMMSDLEPETKTIINRYLAKVNAPDNYYL